MPDSGNEKQEIMAWGGISDSASDIERKGDATLYQHKNNYPFILNGPSACIQIRKTEARPKVRS